MRVVFLTWLIMTCANTNGQSNTLEIDFNKVPVVKYEGVKPQNGKLVFHVRGCTAVQKQVTITQMYKAKRETATVLCGQQKEINLLAMDKGDNTRQLVVSVAADKTVAGDAGITFVVNVSKDGVITEVNSDTVVNRPVVAQPRSYDFGFVDPAFLAPVARTPVAFSSDCCFPYIDYDPCCNRYTIHERGRWKWNSKKDKINYLNYYARPSKNKGVVFFIRNFNVLRYNIAVSNEFQNRFTEIPQLFATVYSIVGGPSTAAKQDELLEELAKIQKLNSELKKFLEAKLAEEDCGALTNFNNQQQAIIARVKKGFGLSGSALTFDRQYQILKKQTMEAEGSDEKKFNENLKTAIIPETEPDKLVDETRKLLTTLVTTRFEYQYNVPQLQNADEIIFKLTIQPKEGVNAPLHMSEQPIVVPLRGGWKVDFTTGLYYSDVRHDGYALRDTMVGGAPFKKIIQEGSEKGTLGINALMHIYPRLGNVQPSLVFGVGKSLDLNYSLLLGAGLLFGRENRFALSMGANWSHVKTLSNQYTDAAGIRLNLPPDATEVKTYNRFKKGLFLSLTYSLGLTNKSQTVQPKEAEKKEEDSKEDKEEDKDSKDKK